MGKPWRWNSWSSSASSSTYWSVIHMVVFTKMGRTSVIFQGFRLQAIAIPMQATGGVNTTLAHAQVFLVRVAQGLRTFALTLLTTFLRRRYGIWYVQLVTQSTIFSAPRTCYEAADGGAAWPRGHHNKNASGFQKFARAGHQPSNWQSPPSLLLLSPNQSGCRRSTEQFHSRGSDPRTGGYQPKAPSRLVFSVGLSWRLTRCLVLVLLVRLSRAAGPLLCPCSAIVLLWLAVEAFVCGCWFVSSQVSGSGSLLVS